MGITKIALPEVADAPQAAAAARVLLEGGVDGIKVFASRTGPLPDGVIQAVVDEAHRWGKPVFLHPNNGADVLAAIRGGVDVIAHTTPHDGAWGESIFTAAAERSVALTPTLALWEFSARHDRVSTQESITRTAVTQVRAWLAAGGVVLFGTDCGAVEPDPASEYALMAEAGMGFRELLAALTTSPAERFTGRDSAGRIAAGLPADLVVLNGDPTRDLQALTHVRYTLRGGNVIYRSDE
jgi:imidazolonepropionase-like amidohydrolase